MKLVFLKQLYFLIIQANEPNEDVFIVEKNKSFYNYGLFDGHFSPAVSSAASVFLLRFLNESIKNSIFKLYYQKKILIHLKLLQLLEIHF